MITTANALLIKPSRLAEAAPAEMYHAQLTQHRVKAKAEQEGICQARTVLAADMIAMSESMLTGAVKVSDRRATRQIMPKDATNAVLVLASRASTEVRISKGLCQ